MGPNSSREAVRTLMKGAPAVSGGALVTQPLFDQDLEGSFRRDMTAVMSHIQDASWGIPAVGKLTRCARDDSASESSRPSTASSLYKYRTLDHPQTARPCARHRQAPPRLMVRGMDWDGRHQIARLERFSCSRNQTLEHPHACFNPTKNHFAVG